MNCQFFAARVDANYEQIIAFMLCNNMLCNSISEYIIIEIVKFMPTVNERLLLKTRQVCDIWARDPAEITMKNIKRAHQFIWPDFIIQMNSDDEEQIHAAICAYNTINGRADTNDFVTELYIHEGYDYMRPMLAAYLTETTDLDGLFEKNSYLLPVLHLIILFSHLGACPCSVASCKLICPNFVTSRMPSSGNTSVS